MFDIASTEFILVLLVALVVIGPKDLPRVLRVVGNLVGKARGVVTQVKSGFDDMVRESELNDLEKKWAEENDRIMREFPDDGGNKVLKAPEAENNIDENGAPNTDLGDGKR